MKEWELRTRALALPEIEGAPARFSWPSRRQNLRNELISGNVAYFLWFPTIREFLYAGATKEMRWFHRHNAQHFSPVYKQKFGERPSLGYPEHADSWDKQQYLLWRMLNYVDDPSAIKSVVEFGGGYGAMAVVALRYSPEIRYYIYDFPEVSLLQEYYLRNADLFNRAVLVSNADHLPRYTDLLIAVCSLSETGEQERWQFLNDHKARNYLLVVQDTFKDVTSGDSFDADSFSEKMKDLAGGSWHQERLEANENQILLMGKNCWV